MIKSLLLAVSVISHEPGYYTSLAKHTQRWLGDQNISARLATPETMDAALDRSSIAFLVGFSEPTEAEMRSLRKFRSRGGKLVVFYSASPELGALMGVKPLGYVKASYPGQWSRMDFSSSFPEGLPKSVLQTSTVLQRAVPLPGKGRVMATWSDRNGRSTGDAAWISTAGGFWMTHVLLADGDEKLKSQLLAAIVGSVKPSSWNVRAYRERESVAAASTKSYALAQRPRAGEIRAVWDHSGCGLYPGDWPRTMKLLQASRVTDLFVNVAGAGFAHYPSSVLPRSATYQREGDQLAACLAAAKGTGIRVHAWMLCFTGTRSSPDRMKIFRQRGWLLKTRDGRISEYLDPSNPAVRKLVLDGVSEIVSKYPVHGIHLDFVRWYERSAKPANAADVISSFVSEARMRVRKPKWLTTAVLGKYPACIASVGQDWKGWIHSNSIDYVVPMNYSDDRAKFESFVAQQGASRAYARRTICGIGVTANESRLDARQVIEQMNIARRHGLAGTALFDLDTTLEKDILPYLRMGIWSWKK